LVFFTTLWQNATVSYCIVAVALMIYETLKSCWKVLSDTVSLALALTCANWEAHDLGLGLVF